VEAAVQLTAQVANSVCGSENQIGKALNRIEAQKSTN